MHTLRTESLFKLTWPIFCQQATQSVVLLADFWFFSHLSDTVAGTIGQLMPIIWMGAFVIPVFAGTGVAVASQYMGAKQFSKVIPTYMTNLALSGLLGCGFAGCLWWFSGDVGRWMGMNAELNAISAAYLSSISLFFVFLGILAAYNAVLSSRGLTHWLMYSSFLVTTMNVALAAAFVLGLHWGVRGVAAASVASIAAAAALSVWLVHGRLGIRFHVRGAVADMLAVLRPIWRIGVANALEPFSYTIQQVILSTMIIGLGVESMAANSYASRPQMFQITFSVALALGSQILMGHWMGARRFEDVDTLYWKAVRRSALVAFIYAFLLWLAADTVLRLFTTDPAILKICRTLLLISIFYEPARAVNIISGFTLKTVGDARFPLILTICFIWGIVPVVILINRRWSLSLAGFWMCFAADEIIRAGINLLRWRTGKWKSMGFTHEEAAHSPGAVPSEALPFEP